jgi:hypothetical protein
MPPVASWGRLPAATELYGKSLGGLDRSRLRYMKDPENSLEEPLKFMTNLLSGDGLAYYPTGYWYGKYHNLI